MSKEEKTVKVKLKKKHFIKDRIYEAGTLMTVSEDKISRHMVRLDGKQDDGIVERGQEKLEGDDLDNAILDALGELDHTNDEHFIQSGKPNLDAVAKIVGQTVSRKEVDAVASDFEREVVEA